jgi:hypothetical protein
VEDGYELWTGEDFKEMKLDLFKLLFVWTDGQDTAIAVQT